MRDLIVGERYCVKHKGGIWEGFVTFDGWHNHLMKVKDIELTKADAFARKHFIKQGFKERLGGTPEFWGFEPVNFSLENE